MRAGNCEILEFPLGRSDIFLDIVDYDQRKSGLPGNVVQFIVHLEKVPDMKAIENAVKKSQCSRFRNLSLATSLFRTGSWRMSDSPVKWQAAVRYHHMSSDIPVSVMLDTIINRPVDLKTPPVFRLDVIDSGRSGSCICLTWHHLLTDARGGEMLFSCLTGAGAENREFSEAPGRGPQEARSFGATLRLAKQFKPMVRRMKELGVKAPGSALPKKPELRSIYTALSQEHTERFSASARRINPVFGETATLMAVCLRAVHNMMPVEDRLAGGYVVPVPLSTRQVSGTRAAAWRPGNHVSICFIPVSAADVHGMSIEALARLVAGEFRQQVSTGLPEAAEAAMEVGRFFPRSLYRWILRDAMDGQLCSFFFSNTGPVTVGGPAGEFFEVAGSGAVSCFHRPMVSQPPGIGFFFSTYNSSLHLTTCWIKGAITEGAASGAHEMILSELDGVQG